MFCERPNGLFPCGKCRACRLRKANEKMIISIFAANEFKAKGQFITLTYNDEHLPKNGLQHSDFSDFMKRLRRNTGVKYLKMFMAGEYGETYGREHFHALFYNHKFPIEEIEKAWRDPVTHEPIGFVEDGTCTPQAMKYVSGYVNKKGYDPGSGKRPPYGRSSCNLPDNLSCLEIVKMCKTGKISYNGRNFSVPRNWRRRYESIWKYFARERDQYQLDNHDFDKKELTPSQVSAIMDMRDRYLAHKRRRKKKCL